MHPYHAKPQWILGREAPQAHEGSRDRSMDFPGQLGQLLCRPGEDDSSPCEDDGLLGFFDQLNCFGQLLDVGLVGGIVRFELDILHGLVVCGSLHHILGEIHEHRAWTS